MYSFSSVQFSSVSQSHLTLCNPMTRSTPGLRVHHQLLEFTQTQVHPAISSSVVRFSSCPRSLPASGCFPMSQLFKSGGPEYWSFSNSPSNEYSELISFRIECLISLQSKGFSRIFSSTTIQKHQFFGISSWF